MFETIRDYFGNFINLGSVFDIYKKELDDAEYLRSQCGF